MPFTFYWSHGLTKGVISSRSNGDGLGAPELRNIYSRVSTILCMDMNTNMGMDMDRYIDMDTDNMDMDTGMNEASSYFFMAEFEGY